MTFQAQIDQRTDRLLRLVRRILDGRGSDEFALGPDHDLAEAGLNSLDMLALVLSIEAEFDCRIPEAAIKPANFRSVASIGRMLGALRQEAAEAVARGAE